MTRPLTEEETLILRAFQRQVDRLRHSRLLQEGKVQFKFTTNISLGTGEQAISFKGHDPVVFQAYLPIFRQFIQQDQINFYRVHNILNQCCDRQDLLGWIRFSRRIWKETLESVPAKSHRYFAEADDDLEAAIERLFYGYGGLFHVNVHESEEEEKVREVQESALQLAFPHLWTCLRNLDSAIYIWLDEPTANVPPLPAEGAE